MSSREKKILQAPLETLEELFIEARNLSWENFGRILKGYYPDQCFPSVSITGTKCAQNCLHCNKHYLQLMQPLTSPEELEKFAVLLAARGGKGMLLSGGYNEQSIVPFGPFLETIAKIKEKTNLTINVHSGLVNEEQAKSLAEARVDLVSFDLITDDQVISEIIKNKKTGEDYIKSYEALLKAGLFVVPHICLGLYHGTEKGSFEALKSAMAYNPPLIVFLGLIPTKGTAMEGSPTINSEFVARMMLWARLKNPKTEQSLGCMRVRTDEIEQIVLKAGVNRIAVPKKKTVELAVKEFKLSFKRIEMCCAIPERVEK